MKIHLILIVVFLITLSSCQKKTNDLHFINKVSGRYLFNSDEVVEVYFKDNELFIKWRDANLHPLKLNDTTFFVKEMNEKIQFLTNPDDHKDYMVFLPKEKNKTVEFLIKKLIDNEKVPHEYLIHNEFDKALEAYTLIKKNDSLNPVINEGHLNKKGYQELRNKNYTYAINIFRINATLYPNSSNVYDSLGDAYIKKGDTIQGIDNYKKSLQLDSSNSRVKRKLKRLEKTMDK